MSRIKTRGRALPRGPLGVDVLVVPEKVEAEHLLPGEAPAGLDVRGAERVREPRGSR